MITHRRRRNEFMTNGGGRTDPAQKSDTSNDIILIIINCIINTYIVCEHIQCDDIFIIPWEIF